MPPGSTNAIAHSPRSRLGPSTNPAVKHKVSLFGESAVGKTSILTRYKSGSFSRKLTPTIGFDFAALTVDVDGVPVNLTVWDTAGQERFRTLTLSHYRNAKGLMLVYSFGCKESFRRIKEWLRLIEERGLSPMKEIIFIVGNQSDLPASQKEVDLEQAEQFSHEHYCRHFVTSAKTGEGIDALFQAMATDVKDAFGPHIVKSHQSIVTSGMVSSHSLKPGPVRRSSSFQLEPPANGSAEDGECQRTKTTCCNV